MSKYERIAFGVFMGVLAIIVLILIQWGKHEMDANHDDRRQRIAVCESIEDQEVKALCVAVAK